jgi:hypothetical protein
VSDTWAVYQELANGNQHVAPEDDQIEHLLTQRCVCGPKWVAIWSQQKQSVVWQFVHQALDGRE